jgi:hypothetical protein
MTADSVELPLSSQLLVIFPYHFSYALYPVIRCVRCEIGFGVFPGLGKPTSTVPINYPRNRTIALHHHISGRKITMGKFGRVMLTVGSDKLVTVYCSFELLKWPTPSEELMKIGVALKGAKRVKTNAAPVAQRTSRYRHNPPFDLRLQRTELANVVLELFHNPSFCRIRRNMPLRVQLITGDKVHCNECRIARFPDALNSRDRNGRILGDVLSHGLRFGYIDMRAGFDISVKTKSTRSKSNRIGENESAESDA